MCGPTGYFAKPRPAQAPLATPGGEPPTGVARRRSSGRGREAHGNLDTVAIEGELLPAFAFEYRAPRAPVFLEAENYDPLPTLAPKKKSAVL